jgi:hypothetical protein
MDAKLLLGTIFATKITQRLAVLGIISALLLSLVPTTVLAAPYGGCNYSNNNYGSDETCGVEGRSVGGTVGNSLDGSSTSSAEASIDSPVTSVNSSTPHADPAGLASGTGYNYLRLLYAALGLLVFLIGMGIAIYIITKKRSSEPEETPSII